MKSNIILISIGLFLLFACGNYGHITQTKQIQTESFLSFKGDLIGVSVIIDDAKPFTPKKNEEEFSDTYLYKILPGNHRIKVYKNDSLLIDEKFYIGNQETKEIKI